jgi:hypothetical protein
MKNKITIYFSDQELAIINEDRGEVNMNRFLRGKILNHYLESARETTKGKGRITVLTKFCEKCHAVRGFDSLGRCTICDKQ